MADRHERDYQVVTSFFSHESVARIVKESIGMELFSHLYT